MQQYIEEDGTGGIVSYGVHDLVPSNHEVLDLLLLVESPHIDELRTGIPMSGEAGQSALRFLLPADTPPEALGPFNATLHAMGDARVGIRNASQIPLQLAAYKGDRSRHAVAHLDWDSLNHMRTNRADHVDDSADQRAQANSRFLLPSLRLRLSRVQFSTRALMVPAGQFAQRHRNSLATRSQVTTLPVPHASNGWWTRATAKQDLDNLTDLKRLFELHTS